MLSIPHLLQELRLLCKRTAKAIVLTLAFVCTLHSARSQDSDVSAPNKRYSIGIGYSIGITLTPLEHHVGYTGPDVQFQYRFHKKIAAQVMYNTFARLPIPTPAEIIDGTVDSEFHLIGGGINWFSSKNIYATAQGGIAIPFDAAVDYDNTAFWRASVGYIPPRTKHWDFALHYTSIATSNYPGRESNIELGHTTGTLSARVAYNFSL